MNRPPDHILVIFGASGDLTRRKLIPALRELQKIDMLPQRFAVLGIGRSKYNDLSYREMIASHLKEPDEILPLLHYLSMDPEDKDAYPQLASRLQELESKGENAKNIIFYLATPPSLDRKSVV